MDSADGYATTGIYLMPLNHTLKMVKMIDLKEETDTLMTSV